jgi:hypothetical protein
LSFGDRFALDRSAHASTSFYDRFFGEIPASRAPVRSVADATPRSLADATPTAIPRLTSAIPAPRPVARSPVAQATPKRASEAGFRLASASDTPVALAYAPNPSVKDTVKELTPKASDPLGDIDTTRTAIYDITSRTVYLPNGRRLEAHSGLGNYMDDVRYVNLKDTGPTPPNVYDLKMREAPFHGVRAIRLIPTDNSKMYGRDGILAHTYLLGPSGQSNGCVSFRDYQAFLDAFERGEINRMVVVERLANTPSAKTVSDWLSDKFKDIFPRS